MDPGHGRARGRVERLKPATLDVILRYARRHAMLVFIDTDNNLKIYSATAGKVRRLAVERMLYGQHPEMKMHLIRTMRGEE
jgi:hypothetical protein